MNILLIGSGGREHALAWKIAQSTDVDALYCAPGNGGIAQVAECVSLADHAAIIAFCAQKSISLVVVGPEQPLVDGLSDALRASAIPVFGCSQAAAQLEGSKGFTKDICAKYAIPTAAYGRFADAASAKAYVQAQGTPIVVKADGLAAGKGVIMAETEQDALEAIDEIFSGKFGSAGAEVVIEEWLHGEEASGFFLVDGNTIRELGYAQDHKRVGEGDTGPNTGGMGTYSPAPLVTDEVRNAVLRDIIEPTVKAMKAEGTPFTGILFAGLMITAKGPQLIEYNVRFGDPETQSLMVRLESDIVPALMACAKGEGLADVALTLKPQAAMCVVMAANGYPGAYEKGTEIRGLNMAAETSSAVTIFHAGTARDGERILATGGRVLGVTATGDTLQAARDAAYAAVDAVDWPEGFVRRDIGWRAL